MSFIDPYGTNNRFMGFKIVSFSPKFLKKNRVPGVKDSRGRGVGPSLPAIAFKEQKAKN